MLYSRQNTEPFMESMTFRRLGLGRAASLACLLVWLLAPAAVFHASSASVVTFAGSPAPITDKDTSRPFDQLALTAADPVSVVLTFPDVRGSFPTGSDFTRSTS